MSSNNLNNFLVVLVLFMALWLSTALTTNIINLLSSHSIISPTISYNSYNYQLILKDTNALGFSPVVASILFGMDIIFNSILVVIFWKLILSWLHTKTIEFGKISNAFPALLAYWLAFILIEEFLIDYYHEQVHINFFCFTVANYILIHLLSKRAL